ncbi:MAG: anti-sigma F factor [Clostridia bacterium]|nr:anti-sigma F factor [Clostridia bacterium]
MNNSMHLEFLSISENESFARAAVAAFAAQLDPTMDELDDIKTSVSEAVTNAIVHGYGDAVGTVHISCVLSGNVITVTVSDRGRGIEDVSLARTPLFTGAKGSERSGLGFTVMETFMDSIEVLSTPGEGTIVTMWKRISTLPQAACV